MAQVPDTMEHAGAQLGEGDTIIERKKDQGLHECEVFGSCLDTAESGYAWNNCKKTQNSHKNFIPIHQFSESNLPVQYHNKPVLRFIQLFAHLVVRLRVNYVSNFRPDGYAFAGSRGQRVSHVGTGWVFKIKDGKGPCPCQECLGNSQPAQKWWELEVFTACHVVFDKDEAQSSSVEFFYDDENSTKTTLSAYDVKDNDPLNDVCILKCAIHNEDIAVHFTWAYSSSMYLKKYLKESRVRDLCVVISHPHGQSKMVTVGEIAGKGENDLEMSLLTDYMYTYTADTCNGCSGAPVLCTDGWDSQDKNSAWPGAGPHSWGNVRAQLNQCGSGAFYVGFDSPERIRPDEELTCTICKFNTQDEFEQNGNIKGFLVIYNRLMLYMAMREAEKVFSPFHDHQPIWTCSHHSGTGPCPCLACDTKEHPTPAWWEVKVYADHRVLHGLEKGMIRSLKRSSIGAVPRLEGQVRRWHRLVFRCITHDQYWPQNISDVSEILYQLDFERVH